MVALLPHNPKVTLRFLLAQAVFEPLAATSFRWQACLCFE